MRDLGEGVDAGVGAAGPVDGDRLTGDLEERGFDAGLDAVGVALALPAREGGAVVGDRKPQTGGGILDSRFWILDWVTWLRILAVEVGLEDDLGGGLVDDGALLVGFAAGFLEGALGGDGGEAFVDGDDFAADGGAEFFDEGGHFLGGGAVGAVHVAGESDDDEADFPGLDDLADAADGRRRFHDDGLERMGEEVEFVAEREADSGVAVVDAEGALGSHLKLKMAQAAPSFQPMVFLPISKFGQNLPVSGLVAFSQAAVGLGIGLLVADKMGMVSRQRTAIALIGAGTAAVVPFAAGVFTRIKDRPESSSRMRQQLDSIRGDASLRDLEEIV